MTTTPEHDHPPLAPDSFVTYKGCPACYPVRVTPDPGEIAETIITEFYTDYGNQELAYHKVVRSMNGDTDRATLHWRLVRQEEMLKRIWLLLLEQKARDGGYDD